MLETVSPAWEEGNFAVWISVKGVLGEYYG